MAWNAIAALEFEIDELELLGLELTTKSGWTRRSTVLRMRGAGSEGLGEDVTYAAEEQLEFQDAGRASLREFAGWRGRFGDFAARAAAMELFPAPPAQDASRRYRRWALESAALDLALRQAGRDLPGLLGREPRPVRYAVSLGLGEPATAAPLRRLRQLFPDLSFKLDWAENWTASTLDQLRETGGVAVVDFKGHYHGAFSGPSPDPAGYAAVAEALPDAILEDPAAAGPAWEALAPHRARVAWDAPLHGLDDLRRLPRPGYVNIKPSRFGGVEELLRVLGWCQGEGIPSYGGGQFELGPGRAQIQQISALFHPDAANDVSPTGFHQDPPAPVTPPSPLAWGEIGRGFPG